MTAERVCEFLQLEFLASQPYTDFVYPDAETACLAQERLYHAGTAEFSPPFGRLALLEGCVVGMIAALPGAELQKRRLQSSLTLARMVKADSTGLRERILLASQTLLKVEPNDFYLSRIAVSPAARGLGVGHQLLNLVEQTAREQCCPRIVLEVSPTHATAERLYRRTGFQEIDDRVANCPISQRTLRYRHFAKRVPN